MCLGISGGFLVGETSFLGGGNNQVEGRIDSINCVFFVLEKFFRECVHIIYTFILVL